LFSLSTPDKKAADKGGFLLLICRLGSGRFQEGFDFGPLCFRVVPPKSHESFRERGLKQHIGGEISVSPNPTGQHRVDGASR
jgi:hypothetical protein